MRLPKITKYRIAVIAEGTRVWPQMRTMRPYSRMTMVLKPVQRAAPSESTAPAATAPVPGDALSSATLAPALDQLHEHLFQAIDLVAHRHHLDAGARKLREQAVEPLLARDRGLEGGVVDLRDWVAHDARRRRQRRTHIQHEGFGPQPAQQIAHAIALDDPAPVDDRDVAAQS